MGEGLYILGTKALAEEFLGLLTHAGIPVLGFVENEEPEKAGTKLFDLPILWVDNFPAGAGCVCGLSTTTRRRFIEQLKGKARFATFVHPSSVILPFTTVGEGTTLSTGVLVASHARIGNHVFINRGARIGHHARINDFVTIQPNANIGGLGEIGASTYIGMGAIIIERLKIGKEVTIAAGSVVTHDVPDNVLVAGNPAVIKKRDIRGR